MKDIIKVTASYTNCANNFAIADIQDANTKKRKVTDSHERQMLSRKIMATKTDASMFILLSKKTEEELHG